MFRLLSIWGQHKNHFRKALFHWRRKKTKAKAKVVASVWGHTNVFNSLPRYSYCILSSAIHPIIKIVRSKIASAARNWINSVPLIEKRRPLLLLLSLSFFFGLIFRPPNLAFAGIQINLFNNSDENRNLLLLFLLLLDAIYVRSPENLRCPGWHRIQLLSAVHDSADLLSTVFAFSISEVN